MEREIRIPAACFTLALLLAGCGQPEGEAQYRTGLKELARGRTEKSILAFESSLQQGADSNRNPLAYNYLGVACYRAGQINKAIASFEASRKMAPLLPDPVYNLAVIMVDQNQDSQAIGLFEKAGLMDMKDSRPYEYLAMLYCRRKQWAEAQRVLAEADKRSPQSPRVLTAMAVLELQTNSVQRAADLLMEALERDKEYAPAIFNLAVLNQSWLKNTDQAAAYYKDFIRLTVDSKLADRARQALLEIKQTPETPTNPVPVQKQEAPAVAVPPITEWRADERRAADKPAPEILEYRELLGAAKVKLVAGQPDEALKYYLIAENNSRNDGRIGDADAALKLASDICPNTAASRYLLAKRMIERRKTNDALLQLKQVVAQSNTWTEAHLLLAETAIQESEYDVALESLKTLTRQPPGNADAQWLLATLYDRHLRQSEKALIAYMQFCQKFPSDPRSEGARSQIAALSAAASRAGSATQTNPKPAGAPAAGKSMASSTPAASVSPSNSPAPRKRQFISPRRIAGDH